MAEGGGSGFDVVRRGYACAEVDAYLALPPSRRPDAPGFTIARRGYDRAQVDRALAAAPAGAVPVDAVARRGFDLVSWGYERSEVDAYLESASGPGRRAGGPRFRVVRRGYHPAQVDLVAAGAVPVFATAWRGYDPAQVDAHLAQAAHRRPAAAVFAVVPRGYRRAQVEGYLGAYGPGGAVAPS
ncbi:DivIVA domain-containing protein [Kitasatospora sp. NPDC056076]|uniref:DivIVA domain-containing protein n=1 Tax=Kitasatospora sp. NPDC056076 TaxID=3345703 RepID=UPI0035E0B375